MELNNSKKSTSIVQRRKFIKCPQYIRKKFPPFSIGLTMMLMLGLGTMSIGLGPLQKAMAFDCPFGNCYYQYKAYNPDPYPPCNCPPDRYNFDKEELTTNPSDTLGGKLAGGSLNNSSSSIVQPIAISAPTAG